MNKYKVSIVGLGFVGTAMKDSFLKKGILVKGYDKFKDSDTFEECLDSQIIFLALPTQFNELVAQYDKSCIHETCILLVKNNYQGLVVIKSTVEPKTTNNLSIKYPNLKFIHNPEFLTTITAFEDFDNQRHIVLGQGPNTSNQDLEFLEQFYHFGYPNAIISKSTSTESESMKIFCNNFYSVKIQFFNELYQLCQKMDCNYDNIKNLMLKNNWINPMHTMVPGKDGQLSYGGYCFPKDTNALLQFMKAENSPHQVLEATINERNIMRSDQISIRNER